MDGKYLGLFPFDAKRIKTALGLQKKRAVDILTVSALFLPAQLEKSSETGLKRVKPSL